MKTTTICIENSDLKSFKIDCEVLNIKIINEEFFCNNSTKFRIESENVDNLFFLARLIQIKLYIKSNSVYNEKTQ